MKTKSVHIALALALVALTWSLQAAPPPGTPPESIPAPINYQGRLVTPANVPYADATHSIDLTLYVTPSGGTKIWSERYSVQTRDGYFSVNLGSGGVGQLTSNAPLAQVLWKDSADAGSPNTFFMALTVRTDPAGNPLATPVESTPRQQFLTTPFAYRAQQSVYASKADGIFSAGTIGSTNVNATNLNAGVLTAGTVNAGVLTASTVNAANLGAGAINTGNLTINSKPVFVSKSVAANYAAGTSTIDVVHGISTVDYDVVVTGWTSTHGNVRGVFVHPASPDWARAQYSTATSGSGTFTVFFLGIRKGLTQYQ